MAISSKQVMAAVLVSALIVGPAAVASADDDGGPPAHVLERAIEGVEKGRANAVDMLGIAATRNPDTGMPDHAQGNPDHATGLERAQEAIAAAIARSSGANNGQGNAFGTGRAAEVHAALAVGISPSTLASHGQKVSEMVKAMNSFIDEIPGRGLGRDKNADDD